MVTGISQDVISEDHEGCGEHELPCNGRGCGRYVVMGFLFFLKVSLSAQIWVKCDYKFG